MITYARKRRKPVSEINVVPYIDVMLVLLIIFMVTAPLVTQGVKVDLPKAEAAALDKDSKPPLIATVDAEGKFYLNVGNTQDQSMSAVDLATLVAAHLQLEPQTPVVVNGAEAVAYSEVVQLMVLLQKAGVPSVGLMTAPPEKKR